MAKYVQKYGAQWSIGDPIAIELACIQRGGEWIDKNGVRCGAGLFTHYQNLQKALWPGKAWHKWNELVLGELVKGGIVGIMGPASSAKTHEAAAYALCTYFAFPDETTILCSSTTRDMLEMRIWGEIKKYFRKARERFPWLPGNFIESKQMITSDGKEVEGREFRNGVKGVACKRGGTWEGLGDYIGIKNKRVMLIADESQLMEMGFFDSVPNLNSNPWFQLIALGNPKDITDPLGQVCEPKEGWESIPEDDKTKVWETRLWGGRCVQLVGTDSPNFDYPEGAEPFPFLIGRRAIRQAEEYYGKESWQVLMMCYGRIPLSAMERRVITRSLCEKFWAFEEPVWGDGKITKIFALDAAYGSVGGDRCVGGELQFGKDRDGKSLLAFHKKPLIIPVKVGQATGLAEDQIASYVIKYCEENDIPRAHVFFDGTGRSSLTSSFGRSGWTAVNPIEFGGRPSDRPAPIHGKSNDQAKTPKTCRDVYYNFVSELWFMVRHLIEAGQFRGMPEEVMMEGQMRAWDIVGANKIQVEPKDKTKERLGRSPDLFDMLVCGAEGARRLGFSIGKLTPKGERSARSWMKEWNDKFRKVNKTHELSYAA